VVICLEQGDDPADATATHHSCFIKMQNGLPFWWKKAIKWMLYFNVCSV